MLAAYRKKNFSVVVVDTVWELFFAALSCSNVKAKNAENEHFLSIHSIFIMHKQKLRCQANSLVMMGRRNKKHKQSCLEKENWSLAKRLQMDITRAEFDMFAWTWRLESIFSSESRNDVNCVSHVFIEARSRCEVFQRDFIFQNRSMLARYFHNTLFLFAKCW